MATNWQCSANALLCHNVAPPLLVKEMCCRCGAGASCSLEQGCHCVKTSVHSTDADNTDCIYSTIHSNVYC